MKKVILILGLLLAFTTSIMAWEYGQPGDYSYDDYSYQDYSYDVTPPTNEDYSYDTGSFNYDDTFQQMTPDDVSNYVDAQTDPWGQY